MNQSATQRRHSIGRFVAQGVAAAVVLLLAACANVEVATQTAISDSFSAATPPPNFTRGLLTRRAVEPLYPIRARNLGIEGWVMLRFSVDENGEVIGNSIQTIEEQPVGYFELSSSNAARRLSFENSRNEVIEDVRYVFRYRLEDRDSPPARNAADVIQFREALPIRLITPPYPPVALELELEGYVVVKFTITERGEVEDIVIDESQPPGVFDLEAIESAQRLRFEPRIVSGTNTSVEDVLYRFDWNLPR